jgi:TonB family protein
MSSKWNTDMRPCAVLASLLLVTAPVALGQEEGTVEHFTDSSSDRTPAITAFPKYPAVARRDRIEGETVVCFIIDARGKIIRPSIRSSTHKIFEKPAMRAIRSSSFEPLQSGEQMATAKTCRTYRFRLDPVTAEAADKAPEIAATPAVD